MAAVKEWNGLSGVGVHAVTQSQGLHTPPLPSMSATIRMWTALERWRYMAMAKRAIKQEVRRGAAANPVVCTRLSWRSVASPDIEGWTSEPKPELGSCAASATFTAIDIYAELCQWAYEELGCGAYVVPMPQDFQWLVALSKLDDRSANEELRGECGGDIAALTAHIKILVAERKTVINMDYGDTDLVSDVWDRALYIAFCDAAVASDTAVFLRRVGAAWTLDYPPPTTAMQSGSGPHMSRAKQC